MIVFLAQNYSTLGAMFCVALVSFALGLLIKTAVLRKQRKRILTLENEMLSNHAKILALEKKIAETRSDKNGVQHPEMTPIKSDRELRAS